MGHELVTGWVSSPLPLGVEERGRWEVPGQRMLACRSQRPRLKAPPQGPGYRIQGRPGAAWAPEEERSWEAAGPLGLRWGVFVSERRALELALI